MVTHHAPTDDKPGATLLKSDAPAQQVKSPRRGGSLDAANDRRRLLWALPALAYLAIFFVYPLWLLVDTSFREVSLGTAGQSGNPLVGTQNYSTVLADEAFRAAIPRTVIFLVTTVLVQLVIGMALAIVLNQRFRGLTIPRFLVYFVWLLPPVVSGAIWKFALDGSEQGAVNTMLLRYGLVDEPVLFLTSPNVALAVIAFVTAWAGIPFVAIVLTAALKDVPEELYEAAKVDGATPWRRFRSVALPSMGPTVGVLSSLLIIYSFKAFDYIFMLTQGGPGTSTATVPFLAYVVSFAQFDFGLGSTIGVFSVLFALLCASPYIVKTWKERDE
jgi:multiple sugar transport system permease protein